MLINKSTRVQRDVRTCNRMRRPLLRKRRRHNRSLRIQLARALGRPRMLPSRARLHAISVASVATSPPPAARTLALYASASLVVALATWRTTTRLALLKRKRRQAARSRKPLPQQAKAPRRSSRPLRSPEYAMPTLVSTLAQPFQCLAVLSTRDCATLSLSNHSLAQRLMSLVLEAPALRFAAMSTRPLKSPASRCIISCSW